MRCLRSSFSYFASFLQDVIDCRNVLLIFFPAGSDGLEFLVGHGNGMYLVDDAGAALVGIRSTDIRAREYVDQWERDGVVDALMDRTTQRTWAAQPNALLRWSWSSLYAPDYASKYYYRYAYPLDIIATVGVHFQLTKRSGKTNRQLRYYSYKPCLEP